MSAATVVVLAGCGTAPPPQSTGVAAASPSAEGAPVATTSIATLPTSTPARTSSSPVPSSSTPKSRADEAFEHWTSQVPVYPGAVPWEAGSRSPALGTAQVEGFFTLTTSWSTTDDVSTVVQWFRSRVQRAGWAGSLDGPVQQWEIVFDSTDADNAAVTAASLSLLIGTGGRGTLVSVVAAGAPIPDRTGDTRIDPDRIVSATVRVAPSGTVPSGWEPRRAKTVTLSPADRDQLIAMLDGLSVQPPMLSGGVAFGYSFVVTLRSRDGSVITVSSDTNHSIQGPVLDFGDGRHVQLDTGRSGYPLLLSKLCGVRMP
ncbi:MAG: hypothetical protein WKF57_16695 [Nakamurella sp.]